MFIRNWARVLGRHSFVRDERGLTTVEYVILLVLIAVLSVVGWNKLGNKVKDRLDASNESIDTNVPMPAKQ